MTWLGRSSVLLCCFVTFFSYVYGGLWLKFKLSENVMLNDETFASISNCDSGAKCAAICHTERFCGFAQYSTHGKECQLVRTQVCGSKDPASQWNLYKRIPVDITAHLAQGARLIPSDTVQIRTNHSIDGIMTTSSNTNDGPGAWWAMDFDSVYPVAKVSITYQRYYNHVLYADLSGTRFTNGPCVWVEGIYLARQCLYVPPTGCWYNASSINITSPTPGLQMRIFEIKIYS